MKLIKEVEIAYFRSILKEKVTDASDLNVIFGRNDSGKSNVLRALNLFFNQQTNPGIDYDFGLDFNHQRRLYAASGEDIRKFIYIKVTFSTPANYRASLGDEFSIKRQWSISGGQYHQEVSRNVPPAKHQYATRFVNQIQFHYIPAVKDRKIFSSLFQKIYGIIVSNANFADALEKFASEVQTNTEGLFKDLESILGFKSFLAPPNNLTELFGALDVDTVPNAGAQSLSLILQRGDGLQVRHIPEILKFISDTENKNYHIWGFEEPENSLELAFAFAEAKRFIEMSKDSNKQIFVTSHSPTFFTIGDSEASKYFISRTESLSHIRKFDAQNEHVALELMGDNFYLPLISKSFQKAMGEIDELKKSISGLNEHIKTTNGPILFVEGETDKSILTLAHEKLFGASPPFKIEAGGGTTKMKALCAEGDVIIKAANQRGIYVLADNDFDGRELAPSLSVGKWTAARNKIKWWLLKPTAEYKAQLAKIGLAEAMNFFCIEDCFDLEFRKTLLSAIPDLASTYKYNHPRPYPVNLDQTKVITAALGDIDLRLSLYSPAWEAKGKFAEALQSEPVSRFEYFREFFEKIKEQIPQS